MKRKATASSTPRVGLPYFTRQLLHYVTFLFSNGNSAGAEPRSAEPFFCSCEYPIETLKTLRSRSPEWDRILRLGQEAGRKRAEGLQIGKEDLRVIPPRSEEKSCI